MAEQTTTLAETDELRRALGQALVSAGAASSEQLAAADRSARERGALFATQLQASGVAADAVLRALSAVAKLPEAPAARLRSPDTGLGSTLKAPAWRLFRAAPLATENGKLIVAFANPSVLSAEAARRLPPHTAYVALEEQVARALDAVFGKLPAPSAPVPKIGQFAIERLLGVGGMASVYLGRDPSNGQPLAVKVMQQHLASSPDFVARFIHEAKANTSLQHENIVQVIAFGEERGQYYLAAEFVDGGTVEDLLVKRGRFPLPVALEIFAQMLEGAAYAHERGIVHRDLKPANLLMSSTGQVKLADFGIAKTIGGDKLTQTGATLGTPAYMSPEQAAARPLDGRSDLFTAGVILFELLTGMNPHQGADALSSLTKLLRGPTASVLEIDPSIPEPVAQVIARLLEREVGRRYPDANAVLKAIDLQLQDARRRYGQPLQRFLANTEQAERAMREDRRNDLVAESRRLQTMGASKRRRALFALHQAVTVDPHHAQTNELYRQLCESEGVRFDEPTDARIAAALRKLEEAPDSEGALIELARLYRQHGYLFRAIRTYKHYVRLRPDDTEAGAQLQALFSSVHSGPQPASAAPAGPVAPRAATAAAPTRPSGPLPGAKRLPWKQLAGGLVTFGAILGFIAYAIVKEVSSKRPTAPVPVAAPAPAAAPEEDRVRGLLERDEQWRKERELREAEVRRVRELAQQAREREEKERAAREAAEAQNPSETRRTQPSRSGPAPSVPSPSIPGAGWVP